MQHSCHAALGVMHDVWLPAGEQKNTGRSLFVPRLRGHCPCTALPFALQDVEGVGPSPAPNRPASSNESKAAPWCAHATETHRDPLVMTEQPAAVGWSPLAQIEAVLERYAVSGEFKPQHANLKEPYKALKPTIQPHTGLMLHSNPKHTPFREQVPQLSSCMSTSRSLTLQQGLELTDRKKVA